MKNRGLKLTVNAIATSLSLLTAIAVVANGITDANFQTISDFLGQPTFKTEMKEGADADEEPIYYNTTFKNLAELKKKSEEINKELMDEGAVLLKNKNNALPLKMAKPKITLFSTTSVDPMYNGGGSGSNNNAHQIGYKEAFESKGFELNNDLYTWYKDNLSTYGRDKGGEIGGDYNVKDAPWDVLPASKTNPADLAIFVLGRAGSEGGDLRFNTGDKSDLTNGNYLTLTETEKSVLQGIKDNTGVGKAFKKCMILMNTANQVELSSIDPFDFDAYLWVSTIGTSGSLGICDILKGDVNPSGRLSSMFWDKHYLNPVYSNMNHLKFEKNGEDTSKPYVVYQEGIYNGYRYAETRYEDVKLNTANAGEFDYYDAVAYPFGYGLSYTTFAYSNFQRTGYDEVSDEFTFTVDVKNTGSVAGKEAAQLYLQKPYTAYDKENLIEKAGVELVDFAKTKVLEPNKSETLTFKVPGKYLASYDSRGHKTYILDDGDYYFSVAKDSHEAINNILKAKNDTIETSFEGNTSKGDASLVNKYNVASFDAVRYSVDEKTGAKVKNVFDNADLTIYDPEGGNKDNITYMSRNNWIGTCKLGLNENYENLNNEVKLVLSPKLEEEAYDKVLLPEKDNIEYPTYDSTATNFQLIDLRVDNDGNPIPFDDPKWDSLLDQLSWEDQITLLSCGVRCTVGISSINKPTTIDHNGGAGMNQRFDVSAGANRGFAVKNNDPEKGTHTSAYVANSLTASTFNKELVSRYGEQWGEDCLWAGYSGIYGPGINGVRGAYGGRTFEYYSEDPILGGKLSAELCKSIEAKGIYVYLKHAILNECENERTQLSTFANEQTIREIYAKQFELAIKDGNASCVMTGYNRIGSLWTGRQGFVNNLLHDEFGMTGFAVTDFIPTHINMVMGLLNGNGLPDRDFLSKNLYKGLDKDYGAVAQALRLETHRILYTVVHSAAMNYISANTMFIPVTPQWSLALDFGTTSIYTLFGVSIVAVLFVYGYDLIENNKDKLSKLFKKNNGGNK